MKLLIATGIYPPHVGGPSFYAEALHNALVDLGHSVSVRTYTIERHLPTGIRHLVYFFKMLPVFFVCDGTIALDTFSVGLPTVFAGRIFKKHIVIRTGGDFLWEQYVERTGEKILFSEFYTKKRSFTVKEKIIFALTRWTLQHATCVVFSTEYQRDIFMSAYSLESKQTRIIENFYGSSTIVSKPKKKEFVCFGRPLVLKNTDTLARAFEQTQYACKDISLFIGTMPREEMLEQLKQCYAVIIPSLSEISPNVALEALMYGKPVIMTRDTGLFDRLRDIALFVDSRDENDIAQKIRFLSDERNYAQQCERIAAFDFVHSYTDIAHEFLSLFKRL